MTTDGSMGAISVGSDGAPEMVWHVLLILAILVTVVRARQQGVPWDGILAAPSQWVHFIIFGGEWMHTMCSCVGLHTRDGHKYRLFWISLERTLDIFFLFREPHHCAESLWRVEKAKRTE